MKGEQESGVGSQQSCALPRNHYLPTKSTTGSRGVHMSGTNGIYYFGR